MGIEYSGCFARKSFIARYVLGVGNQSNPIRRIVFIVDMLYNCINIKAYIANVNRRLIFFQTREGQTQITVSDPQGNFLQSEDTVM